MSLRFHMADAERKVEGEEGEYNGLKSTKPSRRATISSHKADEFCLKSTSSIANTGTSKEAARLNAFISAGDVLSTIPIISFSVCFITFKSIILSFLSFHLSFGIRRVESE